MGVKVPIHLGCFLAASPLAEMVMEEQVAEERPERGVTVRAGSRSHPPLPSACCHPDVGTLADWVMLFSQPPAPPRVSLTTQIPDIMTVEEPGPLSVQGVFLAVVRAVVVFSSKEEHSHT